MVNRLRSGMIMVFCAFTMFGIGWSALQRLTDPMPLFQAVNKLHPELGILYKAIFIAGCLSFLAILIGGVPILLIYVRRAIQNKQKDTLVPFWAALSCLLIFILETAILADWHQIAFIEHHFRGILVMYLILVAIELVVGTVSISLTLARTDFQLKELIFMFIPEIIILFSMVVSAVLSIVLIILITLYAPQLFNTQDVSIPTFTAGIIFMALATIFASIGLKQGIVKDFEQLIQV